jgi:hypothetical protein
MEQRFFKAIWLGRDTATGETLLGISNKVVRARTNRRMHKPDKYDKQMFDVISRTGTTMASPPTSQAQLQPPMVFPSTKKINSNDGDTNTRGAGDKYTSTNRWTTTSTKSNSRHTNGISSTSLGQLTNGHSTNEFHSRQAMPSPPKQSDT